CDAGYLDALPTRRSSDLAKILVGFQAEDSHFSSFFGGKRGFELGRYYLGNGDGATATSGGGANSWAMMSGYGRINYNFDEKYLRSEEQRLNSSHVKISYA